MSGERLCTAWCSDLAAMPGPSVSSQLKVKPDWTTPVTRLADAQQRRRALLVCVGIAIVTCLLFPMAALQWPRLPAFVPAYQAAVIIDSLLCAYLIFGHYRATGAVALLYLGAGCFYTGVILIAQFLSFPGMFGPQSILPGGAQTTIWLWAFWHAGPVVGMLLYAFYAQRGSDHIVEPSARAVGQVALMLVICVGATLVGVTLLHDHLPVLDVNGDYRGITRTGVAPALQVLTVMALLLLWHTTRLRTVLQLWLAVALFALICDNAITMAGGSRLSVGWYIGRLNALVSATVLLLVYLREIRQSYLHTALTAQELAERTTQLSAAKVELQEYNRELREAQRLAQVGSWEWQLQTDRLIWSEQVYRISGRDPALPAPRGMEHAALFRPAGWVQLRLAVKRLLLDGLSYELELEVLRQGGLSRWIVARGEAVRNSLGQIVSLRGTVQDMTERSLLEQERIQLEARAAALSRDLLQVQEEERRRLTCMIDDLLSPNLSAIQLSLRTIMAGLPAHPRREMDTQVEDVRALIEDSLSNLRKLGADLRPAILDFAGLFAAVDSYAHQFALETGLSVQVMGQESDRRLPAEVESCLFRIVQEALSNCQKHALATKVSVELRHDAHKATLVVSDDGVGFDAAAVAVALPLSAGLETMRKRAEFAGGKLTLDTAPGQGTRIHVAISPSTTIEP